MHYMAVWTFKPEHTPAIAERFRETGAVPPEGVTLIARWHDVAGGRGFGLARSDDPAAIARWCLQWSDLMSLEVIPVVNDETLAAVLAQ